MQKNSTFYSIVLMLLTLTVTTGCKPVQSEGASNGGAGLCSSSKIEEPLCSQSTTYSGNSVITGTATFSKRGLQVDQNASNIVTRLTLSDPISSNLPIKFAEVRVLNSAGQIIQCGKTNANGELKALNGVSNLTVPDAAGEYRVEVLSRADHTMSVPGGKTPFKALVSVKEDICSESVYSVSSTVNTTGTGSFPTSMAATALENVSSKIEGGAFNIYNNIISSYEYLAQNTGTQNLTCLNSKVGVFWKAGFNPNQYIYPSVDPGSLGTISFYLRGDNELYINGGILGNVSTADTDHFDDSVIIHELGHHIENVCGSMDSPGGSHSGNQRIDARLAWSEAWGNYFSAHVIKNKLSTINPDLAAALPNGEWLYYFDSEGHSSSGYEYIRFNLAKPGNSTSETLYTSYGTRVYSFDAVNPSLHPGEGHFREVSISRGLFKATNTCLAPFANCVNQPNFNYLWSAFDKQSLGMGQSTYPFRSSIRLLERLRSVMAGGFASLNSMLTTDEALQLFGDTDYEDSGVLTWPAFGIKLVPSGSSCSFKMLPRAKVGSSGASDQRYSNHYFHIDKNLLPGVTAISLTDVSRVDGTFSVPIDLLLFTENYFYNEDCNGSSCSRSVSSDVLTSTRTPAFDMNTYPKHINISSLPNAANYLLNVRAYTPGSVLSTTEYAYTLRDQNGDYLCPNSSF